MNLAIRGIEGQIAQGDSFHNDLHPDLKADFILANPPFNISDWGGDRLTRRQALEAHGVPPASATPTSPGCSTWSTTLRPTGSAGFVLANGSMSSQPVGGG